MLLVIARASTTEQYGTFAVAYSIGMTVALSAILGQPAVLTRYWSQWMGLANAAKARSVLRLSIRLTSAGTGIAFVLVLASGLMGPFDDFSWTFGIAAGTALFSAAFGWAEYVSAGLRARGHIALALAPRDIAWRIAVCIMIGWAIISEQVLQAESIMLMLGGALAFVVAPQIWLLRHPLSKQNDTPLTRDDRRSLFRYSATMWLSDTFHLASAYGGVVIVSTFLGVETAGAFFVAYRTANLLAFVLLAMNLVSGPLVSRYFHSGHRDLVQKIVSFHGFSAALAALAGIILFAFVGDRILAFFNPAYSSYLSVLLILCAGQFLMAVAGPAGILLNQTGHERINLILVLTGGVVSLVAQAIAGFYWGVIGVALGVTLGPLFTNVAAAIFTWRINHINPTGLTLLVQVWTHVASRLSFRTSKK